MCPYLGAIAHSCIKVNTLAQSGGTLTTKKSITSKSKDEKNICNFKEQFCIENWEN